MKIDWHRVFSPSSWVQLGKVDWDYDEAVNKQLDKYGITSLDHYTAKSGGLSFWVQNYPYAYGHPLNESHGDYTLPSLKTRKRIKSLIKEHESKGWKIQCK